MLRDKGVQHSGASLQVGKTSRAPGPLRYVQIASRGEKKSLVLLQHKGLGAQINRDVLRKSWGSQEWTTEVYRVP